MSTTTHIRETAPTLADNLVAPGDLWLQPSTGQLKVCLQVQPTVVFSVAVGGGLAGSAPTIANAPAGGTGAAAGAYDTSANRDAMIASLNALLNTLRAKGIIS